jgi:hypothetical protein
MKKFRLKMKRLSLILRISQSLFLTRRMTSSAEVSLSKYQLPVIVIKACKYMSKMLMANLHGAQGSWKHDV